jgi:hypothetical protein
MSQNPIRSRRRRRRKRRRLLLELTSHRSLTKEAFNVSTPNPIVSAVAPELIAVIKALQSFNGAMGPNPLLWATNYPGAKLILTGTILQQVPALALSETSFLVTQLDNIYAGWVTKLGG